ncbi:unnamed protein product [Hyaloperonospora brassicae]|uniref:RxLR effector candidate protein n=1 Tax=Hyaloperonospora brassicae TaxID=162125 RepID=A0AAV0T3T8_HYABA|nr:unnamed protein product [Hyaloperonospora brassicae]
MRRVFAQMTSSVCLVVALALAARAYALDSNAPPPFGLREPTALAGTSVVGIKPVLPESVSLHVESRPEGETNLSGNFETVGAIVGNSQDDDNDDDSDSWMRTSDTETWKSSGKGALDNAVRSTDDDSFVPASDAVDHSIRPMPLDHGVPPVVNSTFSGSLDAVIRRDTDDVDVDIRRQSDVGRLHPETVATVVETVVPAADSGVNATVGLTENRTAADLTLEKQTHDASSAGKTGMLQLEAQDDDAGSLTLDAVEDAGSLALKTMDVEKEAVSNVTDMGRKAENASTLGAPVVKTTDVAAKTRNQTAYEVVKPVTRVVDVVTNSISRMDRVVDAATNAANRTKTMTDSVDDFVKPVDDFVKPVVLVANTAANTSDYNVSTTLDATGETVAPIVNTTDRRADLKRREVVRNAKFRVDAPVEDTATHTPDFTPRTLDDTASDTTKLVAPVASTPANTTGFTAKTELPDMKMGTHSTANAATSMTSAATTTAPTTATVPAASTHTSAKNAATGTVRNRTFESAGTLTPVPMTPSETEASVITAEEIPSQEEEVKTQSNRTPATVTQPLDRETETNSGENEHGLSSKRNQIVSVIGSSDNVNSGSDDSESDDTVSNRDPSLAFLFSRADTANATETLLTTMNATRDTMSARVSAGNESAFATASGAVDGGFELKSSEFNVASASSLTADLTHAPTSTESSDEIVVQTPTPESAKTALRVDPPATSGPSPAAAPVAAVAPQPSTAPGSSTTESQEALSKRAKDVSGENGAGTSAMFVVVGGLGCVAISAIVVYVKKQHREHETMGSGSERGSMSAAAEGRSSEGSVYNDPLGTRYSSIVMITPNGDGVCIL